MPLLQQILIQRGTSPQPVPFSETITSGKPYHLDVRFNCDPGLSVIGASLVIKPSLATADTAAGVVRRDALATDSTSQQYGRNARLIPASTGVVPGFVADLLPNDLSANPTWVWYLGVTVQDNNLPASDPEYQRVYDAFAGTVTIAPAALGGLPIGFTVSNYGDGLVATVALAQPYRSLQSGSYNVRGGVAIPLNLVIMGKSGLDITTTRMPVWQVTPPALGTLDGKGNFTPASVTVETTGTVTATDNGITATLPLRVVPAIATTLEWVPQRDGMAPRVNPIQYGPLFVGTSEFGNTAMNYHRDFTRLAAAGVLRRNPGGPIAGDTEPDGTAYSPNARNCTGTYRAGQGVQAGIESNGVLPNGLEVVATDPTQPLSLGDLRALPTYGYDAGGAIPVVGGFCVRAFDATQVGKTLTLLIGEPGTSNTEPLAENYVGARTVTLASTTAYQFCALPAEFSSAPATGNVAWYVTSDPATGGATHFWLTGAPSIATGTLEPGGQAQYEASFGAPQLHCDGLGIFRNDSGGNLCSRTIPASSSWQFGLAASRALRQAHRHPDPTRATEAPMPGITLAPGDTAQYQDPGMDITGGGDFGTAGPFVDAETAGNVPPRFPSAMWVTLVLDKGHGLSDGDIQVGWQTNDPGAWNQPPAFPLARATYLGAANSASGGELDIFMARVPVRADYGGIVTAPDKVSPATDAPSLAAVTPTVTVSATGGSLPGGDYYYRVAWNGPNSVGICSAEVHAVVPPGTTGKVTVTVPSQTANYSGLWFYRAIVSGGGCFRRLVTTVPGTATNWVDDGTLLPAVRVHGNVFPSPNSDQIPFRITIKNTTAVQKTFFIERLVIQREQMAERRESAGYPALPFATRTGSRPNAEARIGSYAFPQIQWSHPAALITAAQGFSLMRIAPYAATATELMSQGTADSGSGRQGQHKLWETGHGGSGADQFGGNYTVLSSGPAGTWNFGMIDTGGAGAQTTVAGITDPRWWAMSGPLWADAADYLAKLAASGGSFTLGVRWNNWGAQVDAWILNGIVTAGVTRGGTQNVEPQGRFLMGGDRDYSMSSSSWVQAWYTSKVYPTDNQWYALAEELRSLTGYRPLHVLAP